MTDIQYASDAAREFAKENDVLPEEFDVVEPSGEGGFTKDDVQDVVDNRGGEDAYGGADRIFMARGYSYEDDLGNQYTMRGGEFYRPPEEVAQDVLKMKIAYPEGRPPQCFYCTESFEGENAFKLRDEHVEATHREEEE